METRSGRITGQASAKERSSRPSSRNTEQRTGTKRTKSKPPVSGRSVRRARSGGGGASTSAQTKPSSRQGTHSAADTRSTGKEVEAPFNFENSLTQAAEAEQMGGNKGNGQAEGASNAVRSLWSI
jgi:hypothetical protein